MQTPSRPSMQVIMGLGCHTKTQFCVHRLAEFVYVPLAPGFLQICLSVHIFYSFQMYVDKQMLPIPQHTQTELTFTKLLWLTKMFPNISNASRTSSKQQLANIKRCPPASHKQTLLSSVVVIFVINNCWRQISTTGSHNVSILLHQLRCFWCYSRNLLV